MTREQFRPPDHPHEHFIVTSVVGSYPQPAWLDRVRAIEDPEFTDEDRREAGDDAVRAAILDQQHAGLDVVTDGEMRREGMVEHFAQFIDGYELDTGGDGSDWNANMPTAVAEISSDVPWLVEDYTFAESVADRPVKTTVTGPFTLASFSSLGAYDGVEELAYDMADLVGAEVDRLVEAGADYVQVDEPALGMSPHHAVVSECLDRIVDGVPEDVRLGLHVCSGNYENLVPEMLSFPVDVLDLEFASDDADSVDVIAGHGFSTDIGVGVVDSQTKDVESVEAVEANIREALAVVPPERLSVTPDCGLKPLPREVAYRKIENLVRAARNVEAELDEGAVEDVAEY